MSKGYSPVWVKHTVGILLSRICYHDNFLASQNGGRNHDNLKNHFVSLCSGLFSWVVVPNHCSGDQSAPYNLSIAPWKNQIMLLLIIKNRLKLVNLRNLFQFNLQMLHDLKQNLKLCSRGMGRSCSTRIGLQVLFVQRGPE